MSRISNAKMEISMGSVRCIAAVFIAAVLVGLAHDSVSPAAAAQQEPFDVVVSNGTVTHFDSATDQPQPFHVLDRKTLESMAMTGTTVLALASGVGAGVAATATFVIAAVKYESLGLELQDARADKLQSIRAEFLDPRLKRIQAIHESGQLLRDSDEAKRLLGEIRADAEKPGGPWSFNARALFSTDALYVIAREKVTGKFSDFLGKWLAEKLDVATTARILWQNDTGRRILRKLIVRRWDTLQTRGQLARLWTKALTDEAVKLAIALSYDKAMKEQYDNVYEKALGQHPSTIHATVSSTSPLELRAALAVAPAAILPVMAAQAPIRAFAVPVAVRTYADPVANSAKTENQLINSQRYTVTTSQPNTQSRGDDRSPAPEPGRSHPAPRMPSVGTSFGGGRGETLWTR
jgi:hypothetical protein